MNSPWKQVKLDDLLFFYNGKGIKPGGEGEFPVYGSNGIIGGTDEYQYDNAIIIGRVGAYCGSVSYCKSKFWASDNTIVAMPKQGIIDTSFSYYFLKALNLNNYAGGAAQPLMTQTVIKCIDCHIPPLSIQQKIATILSAYDDLIENNTRRIQILEEMAQRIYREWFVHFRFPGHEKVKMVDSELGMIPEGWEVIDLNKVADQVRRIINPEEVDPSTPYLGLEHFPRKSIALNDWGFAKEVHSLKYRFYKYEILFGKIRPYFHKVGIAPLDGICSSDTIIIVPHDVKFLFLTLGCVSSKEFVDHATQTSQGTKMPRANWDVLKNYLIVLPKDSDLDSYNNIIRPIISEIVNLIFKSRNLRQTRDLLLPKLISGKIDVEAFDIKVN